MALTQFDYLLNAFESASQSKNPFESDYSGKRRALFAHVRKLEVAETAVAAAVAEERAAIPDVLFDGYAVYEALSAHEQQRTGTENVSDVLDAVVRLLRARASSGTATAKDPLIVGQSSGAEKA